VGHLDLDIYNYTAKHIVKQAGLTPQERKSFSQLLETGFVDAFRHFYPGKSLGPVENEYDFP
jgi:exonuclease III